MPMPRVPLDRIRDLAGEPEVTATARHPAAPLPMRLRRWVKARETRSARFVYRWIKAVQSIEMPVIPLVHPALYYLRQAVIASVYALLRVAWWTPLFRARLAASGRGLKLVGAGLPCVMGPLTVRLGAGCMIDTQTTFAGRSAGALPPELVAGNNVTIGWQNTIAVGRRVVLGDNVTISAQCFLAGYPGHPLDAAARAAGAADTEDQVGDIVLEDDVWLATRVIVSAGVRIGAGTVVAAGSIVTRDLPPGVLAAGAPARAIRAIDDAGRERAP
jgi:acetyltransferase-like isoleucine patch superfamily enzyme